MLVDGDIELVEKELVVGAGGNRFVFWGCVLVVGAGGWMN